MIQPCRLMWPSVLTSQRRAAPGCGCERGGESEGLWAPSPSSRASPWWSSPSSSCQTLWSDSDWSGSGRWPEARSSPLLMTSLQCRSSTGQHRTGALVESVEDRKRKLDYKSNLDDRQLTRSELWTSVYLQTFITERNRSSKLVASEKVSELKPKNLVRESRSFTSSSRSLTVILRPLSWEHSMSLKPLSFGWYRPSTSVRAFSWTAKGSAPGAVTVSIICGNVKQRQLKKIDYLNKDFWAIACTLIMQQ